MPERVNGVRAEKNLSKVSVPDSSRTKREKMDEIQMIDIATSLPQVKIDLKYATADNITGQPIYCEHRCLLHPDAAAALARSAHIAALAGFTLLVYDAYRPQKAQMNLWLACPNPDYVIPVTQGSNHSRGTAVDVTLMDEQGAIVDMGSGFDEMHERSHPWHLSIPTRKLRNRLMLSAIMLEGGFKGIATEWWHFELPGATDYPLLTDIFDCYPPQSAA